MSNFDINIIKKYREKIQNLSKKKELSKSIIENAEKKFQDINTSLTNIKNLIILKGDFADDTNLIDSINLIINSGENIYKFIILLRNRFKTSKDLLISSIDLSKETFNFMVAGVQQAHKFLDKGKITNNTLNKVNEIKKVYTQISNDFLKIDKNAIELLNNFINNISTITNTLIQKTTLVIKNITNMVELLKDILNDQLFEFNKTLQNESIPIVFSDIKSGDISQTKEMFIKKVNDQLTNIFNIGYSLVESSISEFKEYVNLLKEITNCTNGYLQYLKFTKNKKCLNINAIDYYDAKYKNLILKLKNLKNDIIISNEMDEFQNFQPMIDNNTDIKYKDVLDKRQIIVKFIEFENKIFKKILYDDKDKNYTRERIEDIKINEIKEDIKINEIKDEIKEIEEDIKEIVEEYTTKSKLVDFLDSIEEDNIKIKEHFQSKIIFEIELMKGNTSEENDEEKLKEIDKLIEAIEIPEFGKIAEYKEKGGKKSKQNKRNKIRKTSKKKQKKNKYFSV